MRGCVVAQHGLPQQTDNTITNPDELFEEIDKIRLKSFTIDDEEILAGLRCEAAPIKRQNGNCSVP